MHLDFLFFGGGMGGRSKSDVRMASKGLAQAVLDNRGIQKKHRKTKEAWMGKSGEG